MANVSKTDRGKQRRAEKALQERLAMAEAGLTRRDLVKMGLMTSAGLLLSKSGLAQGPFTETPCQSPPTRAFIENLPIPPVKQPVASLSPTPTIAPNTAAGEGRTRAHQAFAQFAPQRFYQVTQRAGQMSMSPDLPLQTIWGFDGIYPGPTYVAQYGQPILVRNVNNLPTANGGFGINSVSTHLHNAHTPSESDGFACDFFGAGQFYDQHYPNVLAGVNSTHQAQGGDINEALSTLWYHDHRVDFTSQNVTKGLAGFYLLFNQFDTGNETTGFRIPSGAFDIPLMFADKCFNPNTGLLFFDLFNRAGVLGDRLLVNGKIQPVLHVSPRRYRLRLLNTGPSRFAQFFLLDGSNIAANNTFWQISSDGNLLPRPVRVSSVRLGVAERADVIVDFTGLAGKTLYLENRLDQTTGRGPSGRVLAAGAGSRWLQIVVDGPSAADNSADPATAAYYALPNITAAPRVTRTFTFNIAAGQWTVNNQIFNCNTVRFQPQQNSVERWVLRNNSGAWQHPIHIHFEEFQILAINGAAPTNSPLVNTGRKDVVRLEFNSQVDLLIRFRDFQGRYHLHCHNTIHEDHAMMLRFDISAQGDTIATP